MMENDRIENDYDIIAGTDENESIFLEVLGSTRSGIYRRSVSRDFWRWKHCSNPFGRSYMICAWDKKCKKGAGIRVLMRWAFEYPEGGTVFASRAVDTATHPDYQRKGIFSFLTKRALSDLREEKIHFIFNTPNKSSFPGYIKLGWEIVGTPRIHILFLNPFRFLANIFSKPAADPPDTYFAKETPGWPEFYSDKRAVLPDLISSWEKRRTRVGYRTPRNMEYLNWRYGSGSGIIYKVIFMEDAHGLAGFAILRPFFRKKTRVIILEELFLRDTDDGLGKKLLSTVGRQIQCDCLAAYFTPGTFEEMILIRFGSMRIPYGDMILTINPLRDIKPGYTKYSNWYITAGDLELF